jgi:hypothetical protein
LFLDSCYNADYSTALKPGDSGAWVVDDTTNEVYGHVVASDVFGVAYVVPINDIFEDIKLRLSLEVVDLPFGRAVSETGPEIEAARHNSMTFNASNPLLGVDKNNGMEPEESVAYHADIAETQVSTRRPSSNAWTRDLTLLRADPPLKEFRQILDRQDTAVGSPSKQPLPVDQARSGKELPEPSDRLQSSTTSPETHLQEVPFEYGASQPSFNIYTQPDLMDSYLSTLPYTQQYPTVPDRYARGYQIIGIHPTTACDPKTFVPYPPYVGYVPPINQGPYPDSGYSTMNNSPAPSQPQQGTPTEVFDGPPPAAPRASMHESDPSGQSRFQRFKAKVGELRKKIS